MNNGNSMEQTKEKIQILYTKIQEEAKEIFAAYTEAIASESKGGDLKLASTYQIMLKADIYALLARHGINDMRVEDRGIILDTLFTSGKILGVGVGFIGGIISHIPGVKTFTNGYNYGKGLGYYYENRVYESVAGKTTEWKDKFISEVKVRMPQKKTTQETTTPAATPAAV
jgi:hypothetical protein